MNAEKNRFFSKTQWAESPHPALGTRCLLWTASLRDHGYGQFWFRGTCARKAHRVAWILERGEIPDGMEIMHMCDNPLCVNVEHMAIGSHADNIQDCIRKGRFRPPPVHRGEENNGAKLTWDAVREMRRKFGNGARKCALAKEYGISRTTAGRILTNRLWKECSDIGSSQQEDK